LARIGEIRSSARENLEKTGAKGAKSIPAHPGRFNGTVWKRGFFGESGKKRLSGKGFYSVGCTKHAIHGAMLWLR
jgi:hypothetical protein